MQRDYCTRHSTTSNQTHSTANTGFRTMSAEIYLLCSALCADLQVYARVFKTKTVLLFSMSFIGNAAFL